MAEALTVGVVKSGNVCCVSINVKGWDAAAAGLAAEGGLSALESAEAVMWVVALALVAVVCILVALTVVVVKGGSGGG